MTAQMSVLLFTFCETIIVIDMISSTTDHTLDLKSTQKITSTCTYKYNTIKTI